MREVAVFVPGILGSCLAFVGGGNRQTLWDEDALANYRRLLDTPDLLAYSANLPATPTGLMLVCRIPLWPGDGVRIYKRIVQHLRNHPMFGPANGEVIEFSYDWRESARMTAGKLGTMVGGQLGVDLAQPVDGLRLTFVTHSMGAYSTRLAIAGKRIHPANVRQIIHLAPPLLGSAQAFRAAFHAPKLSVFGLASRALWPAQTNRRAALRTLRDALLTCPSMYELMPPQAAPFLAMGGHLLSPFEPPLSQALSGLAQEAVETHSRLRDASKTLREGGVSVTVIRGNYLKERTDGWYSVDLTSRADDPRYLVFRILEPLPCDPQWVPGDGTVTCDSASAKNTYTGDECMDAVGVQHDRFGNDRRRVFPLLDRALLMGS